jgi:hypothetical protein
MNARPSPRLSSLAVAALCLTGIAGCTGPAVPDEPTPGQIAVRLFDIAREEEPDPERLSTCLEVPADASARAALFDALSALGRASAVQVERIVPLDGMERTVVDLSAFVEGGGTAQYSVQLEDDPAKGWRILWFLGPGVEWPRARPPRGNGLTVSADPAGDGS